MKIESNKNWTTCLRLNTGDGSPRVFLLNSHFLGSVPKKAFLLLLFYACCFCSLRAIHGRTSPSPRSANGIMIFEIKTNHHSDGFCA